MSHWKLSPETICQEIGGEMVIMHMGSAHYFEANRMTCEIVQLIKAGLSLEKISAELLHKYDVGKDQLESDLKGLLQQLCDLKIIQAIG